MRHRLFAPLVAILGATALAGAVFAQDAIKIGVTQPLQAGRRVALRFTLDGGAAVETQATVREDGAGR